MTRTYMSISKTGIIAISSRNLGAKFKKNIPWVATSQTVDLDFMLIYMHISRSKADKWKVSYNNI